MITYFSQKGFSRLFSQARKRYESLGRVGGTIRLSRLKEEEKQLLSGLLSRDLAKQESLTLSVQELEKILLESRFEIDLLNLLQGLYGEVIKPKVVQAQEAEQAWLRFIGDFKKYAIEQETKHWLSELMEGKGSGYRTLNESLEQDDILELAEQVQDKEYWREQNQDQDMEYWHSQFTLVLRALDQLPVRQGEKEQLPIFAAEIAGDAHFLDRVTMWGRLFYYGILSYLEYQKGDVEGTEQAVESIELEEENENGALSNKRTNSYLLRQTYEQVGLVLDSLSSQVIVIDVDAPLETCSFALTLDTVEKLCQKWKQKQEGLGEEPLYDDEEQQLDVGSIEAFIQRVLAQKKVYISENPAICSAIIDHLAVKRAKATEHTDNLLLGAYAPLICTSGQPSVAAILLLDFFAEHDVEMFYSGDLDVKGLEMAISLEQRYTTLLHPWGMTSEVVTEVVKHKSEEGHSGVTFSKEEAHYLQRLACRWDSNLLERLGQANQKIFQEMIVSVLIGQYERNRSEP